MKQIEIRRHSKRNPPYPNLTQEGVELARRAGQGLGPFQRVVTSTIPRTFQTAIAMGFAVDEQAELLFTYGSGIERIVPWPQPFAAYQSARKEPEVAAYLHQLAGFYQKLATNLPENGKALVVNHGGVVELSAVACLPDFDFSGFGDYCSYCEGVRLAWEGGKFVSAEVLRV
jgi:broad specificity phosphatase PhoE